MTKEQIVTELIETVINGNSISNNDTYKKMLNRVTFKNIVHYASLYNYKWSIDDIGRSQKIDLIKSIVNNLNKDRNNGK
jgi:hypothetical protein